MLIGTPLEEPFRVLVWLVIGLPLAGLIIWLGIVLLSFAITYVALMVGVFINMVLYVVGIPLAIYNHYAHRW